MEESFEGLGFFELRPDDLDDHCNDNGIQFCKDTCRWSQVSLAKPYVGSCTVIIPAAIAESISESLFMETEQEIGEQEINDTVGEIANIVAGQLLCILNPFEKDISLGLPTTGRGWPQLDSSVNIYKYLTDEDIPIFAAVEIK